MASTPWDHCGLWRGHHCPPPLLEKRKNQHHLACSTDPLETMHTQSHIFTLIHGSMYVYSHTDTLTHRHSDTHSYTFTLTYTQTHTLMHSYTHITQTHTHTCLHSHTLIHTYMHTHIHLHSCTLRHAHSYTFTLTYTQTPAYCVSWLEPNYTRIYNTSIKRCISVLTNKNLEYTWCTGGWTHSLAACWTSIYNWTILQQNYTVTYMYDSQLRNWTVSSPKITHFLRIF